MRYFSSQSAFSSFRGLKIASQGSLISPLSDKALLRNCIAEQILLGAQASRVRLAIKASRTLQALANASCSHPSPSQSTSANARHCFRANQIQSESSREEPIRANILPESYLKEEKKQLDVCKGKENLSRYQAR